MKINKSLVLTIALAVMMPVMAHAKDNDQNQANVEVPEQVQVGSAVLRPGTYKVQWSGTGSEVQVNFIQRNKTVATAQGKLVDLQAPAPHTDIVTEVGANQKRQLVQIDFNKRTQALQLVPSQGMQGEAGQQ